MPAGTAYTKRYPGGFSDLPALTTPADSAFLNAVEAALLQLLGAAPSADGQVAQWDQANTRFGPALILNKNIDPAAAIAKSKLDLTGANGIVDADISGTAAIARSKLNFGSGLVNADVATNAAIALSKLAGSWTSYTPTWTTSGTAPSAGNANFYGKYIQVGKLVMTQVRFVAGSTTTFGTGAFSFSLPVAIGASGFQAFGSGYIYDNSASSLWTTTVAASVGGGAQSYVTGAGGAFQVGGASAPFAWAVNDEINMSFFYEAA